MEDRNCEENSHGKYKTLEIKHYWMDITVDWHRQQKSQEHKERSIELIQPDENREKIKREIKQGLRYLWNNIKVTNIYLESHKWTIERMMQKKYLKK